MTLMVRDQSSPAEHRVTFFEVCDFALHSVIFNIHIPVYVGDGTTNHQRAVK